MDEFCKWHDEKLKDLWDNGLLVCESCLLNSQEEDLFDHQEYDSQNIITGEYNDYRS